MKKISVAYDERWVRGGIGRFSLELLSRFSSDGVEMLPIGVVSKIADPLGPLAISSSLKKMTADVFWSPGFVPPSSSSIPFLITIHDLIHRQYGGFFRRVYYDAVIRFFARSAYSILTVSEYSRSQILHWLGRHSPPVVVVGNGVSASFSKEGERYESSAPYVLYCGNQRSHKNIGRMLEAFAIAKVPDTLLLGMTGTPESITESLIQKYGLADRVFWLGWLDEAQLAAAYRGAEFLMLVSLEEGFGLPVVEAMACGTPVLCSSTTSLGEIAGDAAVTVDPHDVECIAAGIERIASDTALRQVLRERGLKRAADFSWDNVAQRVKRVLEAAANKA